MFGWNIFSVYGVFPIFGVVIVLIVVLTITNTNNKNNKGTKNNPKLIVEAVLVSKRIDVRNNTTAYFLTFQVESGDRIELPVSGTAYGQYVETDYGRLTFQGNKFWDFQRTPYLAEKM